MLERDVERYFCEAVKGLGGVAVKFVSPGRAGMPDRLVLLPGGKAVMVELKAASGRLSPIQLQQIKRIRKLGFPVYVAYGRPGVEDLVALLKHRQEVST